VRRELKSISLGPFGRFDFGIPRLRRGNLKKLFHAFLIDCAATTEQQLQEVKANSGRKRTRDS
jgi:hypothetical protein